MDENATFEAQAVLAPRRRSRNALGIAVAGLAVVATVGAGLLGQRLPSEHEQAAVVPRGSGAGEPSDAVASPPPQPTLSNFHPPSLPRYPTTVLGLRVQPAAYVDVDREGENGLVAVAGWYAARPGTGCPTPRLAEGPELGSTFGVSADPDTFCERAGQLFTAPTYGEHAPPIPVQLRAGVPAPYELRSVAIISPVVLVGRLVAPEVGCEAPRSCEAMLVVDRVAWSGGRGLPRTSSVLPRLLAWWPPLGSPARDRLIAKAIGDSGEVLLDTMVDPATLARIDPAAAELLATTAPTTDRIWYRRVLGADPAVDPVLWVAVDDATGNVIGSGSVEG